MIIIINANVLHLFLNTPLPHPNQNTLKIQPKSQLISQQKSNTQPKTKKPIFQQKTSTQSTPLPPNSPLLTYTLSYPYYPFSHSTSLLSLHLIPSLPTLPSPTHLSLPHNSSQQLSFQQTNKQTNKQTKHLKPKSNPNQNPFTSQQNSNIKHPTSYPTNSPSKTNQTNNSATILTLF